MNKSTVSAEMLINLEICNKNFKEQKSILKQKKTTEESMSLNRTFSNNTNGEKYWIGKMSLSDFCD